MCCKSTGTRLENNICPIGTVEKYHKPFETDEKMKVAKPATTKTSFLTGLW